MLIFCPVCSNPSGNYNVELENTIFSIYKCSNCGLEYTNPMPSDEDLNHFYNKYSDIRANGEIVIRNAKNNLNKLYDLGISSKSYILDFGSGNGEFVDIAGKYCYGVELNKKEKKDRIFYSLDELPISQFDCITLYGVLEHLNNIKDTMNKLMKMLKKDGLLVITTVDAEGIIPYYYKPPEHLTYWTKRSLENLAEYLNSEIIEYTPYFMEQMSDIYLDRLFSRTPDEQRNKLLGMKNLLPKVIKVPTNEFFAVIKKK
jgi:SAM-dependent methyltransferase